MIVLLIILGSIFAYLMIGRLLVVRYRRQITKTNTTLSDYYDKQDKTHYTGRNVSSDNRYSLLAMQFAWPVYFWVMKTNITYDEVELEVDDQERTEYTKYLEDSQQRLARLQERQEKLAIERIQKLAELEKDNPLSLSQETALEVVLPKAQKDQEKKSPQVRVYNQSWITTDPSRREPR
jgi:hypothetical protein